MKRYNAMRKKLIAFVILITMLCNNSAVPIWAAAEEETQVVSSSENNEPSMDIPDNQEEQTESGETMTGTESTDSDREQPEAANQGTDLSTDQSEAPQEDIPEVSPEEVIEIEDYIREEFGEEYVSMMNEKLEPDDISESEDMEVRAGSYDEFIVDLAISAKSNFWNAEDAREALEDNGYTTNGCNTNSGAGNHGDYIYIGWKYTDDLQSNIGSVMTGLLIRKNDRVSEFKYNGKTYYPLNTRFEDSNFNLNQGNDGKDLFIYFTRDGAKDGDPVISTMNFGVSIGTPADALMADGYDNGVINHNQDLSEGGGGDYVYLAYKYHTHSLTVTSFEDCHSVVCKFCNFHKEMEPHEYEYASISDSQHEGTCKVCKHKILAPHMDTDHNLKCDVCQIPVEAYIAIPGSPKPKQTGAYKTFTAAWKDAVAKKTDCYLNLLKDISLTNSNIAQGAQHLTPMENGKTITIQTHVDKKEETKPKAKIIIDGNNFQNLSEVFYVRNGELIIDTNITIDGGVSFNSFMTASSSAAKLKIDKATIDVKGSLNKDLSVITADQSALLEVSEVNMEFTGSRGSKPYSIYGIHVMNGSTAEIALATINDFDQAFRVNNAKLDIHEGHYRDKTVVYVEKPGDNSEILIQGGEFTGTDGYCLDSSGAKVSIEVGKFTGSLRVGENQKISSVLAPGRYAAEIDTKNEIARRIPYAELEAAGNKITFAKRTMIDKCENHYASTAVYYSRKTHTEICEYCGQKELIPHEFDAEGKCKQCGVNEEIVLITNAGSPEYYNSLEDAVKAIRERTGVTLKLTRSIEATDPFAEDSTYSKRDVLLDLNGYTLILNSKENSAQVMKNFNLTIVNGVCTVPESDFLIENSKLILGKNATLNFIRENLKFGTASDLILQKNAKLGLYDTLNITDGCSLTLSDQASLDFKQDVYIGLHVLGGASLYVSGEASVNLNNTLDSPHTIVIDAGATARFTGGIINSEEGNAIEIGKNSEYKDLRYLLEPGYAYYIKSGTDWVLTNYAFIDSYSVLHHGQYMIKPHDEHVYDRYEDLKNGTHRSYCSVCRIIGEISRHSSKNGSHDCQFCKAEYSCSHEFDDPGICKTCGLKARVCVTVDHINFYYLSMNDAWDNAKGKKAIIHLLFGYGEDIERVIEDKDDITIEYPEHKISTNSDLFTVNGGKLTISEGCFDTKSSSHMAVVVNDGELIINGGKIESKITINGGKVTINNATFNKDVIVNGGEVVINDGDFQGSNPIMVYGGKLTITGGDFYAHSGLSAMLIDGGHVTLQGGQFRVYRQDYAGVLFNGGLVTTLLTPGYYYAEPGTNTPAKIDPKKPDRVQGDVTVKLHEDHSGYWKDGVCSLCKYECTHPSFEGRRCAVCGVGIESQLFVVYKEGDDSKRESFDHLQDALNFASQHPGSELIVSKDIPADATDKTSYIVQDTGLSVDSSIDFTIQLGKHTIGTQLFVKKAKVNIKGDDGGISVSAGSALQIGLDAEVHVDNCNFRTDDSKFAAISIKDSKTVYLRNVHANGGYAVDASDVRDTVTLDGGYYCTASGDKDSSLQAVAFTGTSGTIKGCTITATAEDAAALYLYRCDHVVIDNTRLLIDDTAKGANSIRIPSRGSSETELVIVDGSEIYEMTSGKNITDDHSEEGRISESVDKSIYIGKVFPEKQAQIIGYEPLADIVFPAGTAIDDIIAKIPIEANAVTLNYPDKKVKVKVSFDKEEIKKAIQKVYDQETKGTLREDNRDRTKKIDIYANGIVSGWPEDISVVLEDTLNLRLCVEVRKYSVTLNDGQTKQEYFTGDTVELHMDGHTHGKVFSHWDVIEGDVNLDISLPENSFIMPSDNLVINAVYEEQLELIPEKTATCTEPGNKAYYICDCGQWFWSPEDAKADKPIEDHNKVLIPAAGHIDKDMDDRCDICCEKLTHKDNEGEVNNRTNGKTEGSNNSGVFTGDQSDLLTWLILLVGSSLGLYVLIRRRRYH